MYSRDPPSKNQENIKTVAIPCQLINSSAACLKLAGSKKMRAEAVLDHNPRLITIFHLLMASQDHDPLCAHTLSPAPPIPNQATYLRKPLASTLNNASV